MFPGARVTDAVDFFWNRGELKGAVKIVRLRSPERYRWRTAVHSVTAAAAALIGRQRVLVEEPVREIVLELDDGPLQREVVLDARRHGLDLDRGEILPMRTGFDLRRFGFLTAVDLNLVRKYFPIPDDASAPVDTGAVTLVGRALANAYMRRAQRAWLELPDPDGPAMRTDAHHRAGRQAELDSHMAQRWGAFSRALTSHDA